MKYRKPVSPASLCTRGALVLALLAAVLFSSVAACLAQGTSQPTASDLKAIQQNMVDLQKQIDELQVQLKKAQQTQEQAAQKQSDKEKAFKLEGYTQVRYMMDNSTDGKQDQFLLRRSRFNVKAKVGDHITLKTEMQLAAKASGEGPGSKFELRDAYLQYDKDRYFVKMGQFTIPFSFDLITSSKVSYTSDRSVLYDRLFPDDGDVGIQYEWTKGEGKPIVDFGFFNGTGINSYEDNPRKDLFVSMTVPYRKTKAIVSYYGGKAESGSDKGSRSGIGVTSAFGKFEATAEAVSAEDATDSSGWYAQLGYRLNPAHTFFAKCERFDEDTDTSDDAYKQTSFGWIWNFEKNSKISLCYQIRRPDAGYSEYAETDGNLGFVQWQAQY